jgi:dTDP-glucose pyrophosphorylase
VYHPVLKELRDAGIEPKVAFQPEDSYGPGAAVSVWSQVITEPVTILFGDNMYAGSIPKGYNDVLDSNYPGAIFTTRFLEANARNLQLAAVVDGVVIEKPHAQIRGDYFCGFARLPAGYLQQLGQLKKSERGEIEITEMVNFAKERTHWDIDALGLTWSDLTYESDVANMRELIGHEG